MKVRLYKAPDGKGKLVKAKDGMAVNIDKEINKKIAEGKDPEIIIYEMAEFGLSRDQARDKVYKQYDLLGDDEYDEDEVAAPYDRPVQEETAEVVEEDEPDNAAIYDYYGGDNQGLDVVNEGADEDDDEDMARYGGQYAEGGQFAPGSIIPTPKKPYYIGMDAEPYDNAYKFGGLTKGAYVKQRIKELRKAAQGEEVKNNETNISPRGTIDSPSGFTPPEKNLAAIIKQTGNEAKIKQQAENEYQQYQESTMGDNFNGKFLFGGRNRKIARANRALFGTSRAIPGVDVNYEFGPLGGLRKAEATWDLDAIGDLAKMLPGAMNMFSSMMGPSMMSYKKVSYPAQIRKKTITSINNAALDEVAKQNPNSTAAQNNKSSKKNEIKCPPGAVYDSNRGHCVDQEGNMVRSIVDLPDPEELLGNPFQNPNARMLNGKKTMKATGPSSSVSSTAATQSTQASSVGGAPLQSQQTNIPGLIDYGQDWMGNAQKLNDIESKSLKAASDYIILPKNPENYGYMIDPATGEVIKNPKGNDVDQRGLVWSGQYDNKKTPNIDESLVWSNPVSQEEYESDASKYDWSESYIVRNPDGTESSKLVKFDHDAHKGSEYSPYYKNQNKLWDEQHNADYDYDKYIAEMPKDIRKKNYKQINKQIGADIINADGSVKPEYNIATIEKEMNERNALLSFPTLGTMPLQKQFGGPINDLQPDEYGNLQKFIYGGDEYAYGGDVLPRADDGFAVNFQKQMLDTKNRIDQMGSKNPADYNPFKGNAFGKATTGIQPSGTVGNRFQPTGQPNTSMGIKQDGSPDNVQPPNRSNSTGFNPYTGQLMGDPNDPNAAAKYAQFMQMMQGQQSNPFTGYGFGNQQFWTGRPQRLGLGFSRDFNYTNAFSPVNWQVPEGTKKIKEVAYKDRGKWYNPFDTKRIREWYADPEDGATDDLINKQGSGKNINTETTDTNTSTTAEGAQENVQDSKTNKPNTGVNEDIPKGMHLQTSPKGGIDRRGRVVMYDNYDEDTEENPEASPNTSQTQEVNAQPSQFWQDQQSFAGSPLDSSSNTAQSNLESMNKNPMMMMGTNNTSVNESTVPTINKPNVSAPQFTNPFANMSGPMGAPINEQGVIRREYGGYVPDYMAYGGYLPEAKGGITVDKPEFNDPNLIGRTVEQSAYTFNPPQLAADLFGGKGSLTGMVTTAANAWDDAKKMDQAAQRYRTADAATANTGQSGFGSAERRGSDLMAKGTSTQYGTTPGQQGYEGGLYGKKGGEMNSQYAKGKVYSLTMEQIKAIEAAGGKVEYIK